MKIPKEKLKKTFILDEELFMFLKWLHNLGMNVSHHIRVSLKNSDKFKEFQELDKTWLKELIEEELKTASPLFPEFAEKKKSVEK